MAFGLYGEVLPNQNGASMRPGGALKYGFKSAKSIVKIRLVEQQPVSSWTKANAREYGFFSNVNPAGSSSLSQATEPAWVMGACSPASAHLDVHRLRGPGGSCMLAWI